MIARIATAFGILLIVTLIAETADAQIWNRIRDRVASEAEERVEERAVQLARSAMDLTEDTIVCLVTDPECIAGAEAEGRDVVVVDEDGQEVSAQEAAAAGVTAQAHPGRTAPGEGAWVNYDFVPGERVLFFEDFSAETVGRFPSRMEFVNGMLEIAEWEGDRMLRSTDTRSTFRVNLPEALPERFTIEFEAYFGSRRLNDVILVSTGEIGRARSFRNMNHPVFYLSPRTAGVRGPVESTVNPDLPEDEMITVRIAVDGRYATMYLNERRVANIPNADLPRNSFVDFRLGQHSEPSYIDNLRIAAGGREMMYDRLIADGRIATQGILFATASAQIRPESTPTLNDIAQMLERHGDLRIRIEGHTDSVGSAAANQRLSEQRAQAVVDHLVNRAGVAADRLEAAGMGETEPVDTNDTAEGRQNNRRVELVVLN
jgi:OmpA-OmpF porin, OOP family